jgi:hypothetical protein
VEGGKWRRIAVAYRSAPSMPAYVFDTAILCSKVVVVVASALLQRYHIPEECARGDENDTELAK